MCHWSILHMLKITRLCNRLYLREFSNIYNLKTKHFTTFLSFLFCYFLILLCRIIPFKINYIWIFCIYKLSQEVHADCARLEIVLLIITVDTRMWILGKVEYSTMNSCSFYCYKRYKQYCYRIIAFITWEERIDLLLKTRTEINERQGSTHFCMLLLAVSVTVLCWKQKKPQCIIIAKILTTLSGCVTSSAWRFPRVAQSTQVEN